MHIKFDIYSTYPYSTYLGEGDCRSEEEFLILLEGIKEQYGVNVEDLIFNLEKLYAPELTRILAGIEKSEEE